MDYVLKRLNVIKVVGSKAGMERLVSEGYTLVEGAGDGANASMEVDSRAGDGVNAGIEVDSGADGGGSSRVKGVNAKTTSRTGRQTGAVMTEGGGRW